MFTEDDLLPISAIEHLVFCERQCALIHLEQVWSENLFTAEGRILHNKTHSDEATESRGDIRIARGLRLHSLRLGLAGMADVVEFHRVKETQSSGEQMSPAVTLPPAVALPGVNGLWRPFPIEYKRGKLRHEEGFEVQLCAEALCLEEMMHVHVPAGAVFYGKTVRRLDIVFDAGLRSRTEDAAARLHILFRERKTPKARYEKKCDKCSLFSLCMPKTTGLRKDVQHYLRDAMSFGDQAKRKGSY
ncbi:MAG: CRISPR-associated protein Cas4 [Candidatus Abyssobacteria bacterium SURF_5]|uniref:CRISPR-associated exonuclease Cas4 n=1 Tax=Abyssobacteria bacterium (strain SURF_5) TaxID=2093360 RepID=A0A3A4NKR8_ABYX5|nr:MAG: CRISPR-associated protein Cas4 [Candidatus Abyssubacteria bacterium SURF_5]